MADLLLAASNPELELQIDPLAPNSEENGEKEVFVGELVEHVNSIGCFGGGTVKAAPRGTRTPHVVGSDATTKPLFIPRKREYFEQFRDGTKPNMEEYRPEGQRWNARTCAVGRPVVLSLGYGKAHRLSGHIAGYRSSAEPTQTDAWKACYGERRVMAACIRIELDGGTA